MAPPCCGAPGWRLRARALTSAAVVVLSGKLRLVVVVLVVMVWLHPASATTPFGELLLAPLLISLMHSS